MDPTPEMSMVQAQLSNLVVMTQNPLPWAQRCGLSIYWSVPGDHVVSESTSYTHHVAGKILVWKGSANYLSIQRPHQRTTIGRTTFNFFCYSTHLDHVHSLNGWTYTTVVKPQGSHIRKKSDCFWVPSIFGWFSLPKLGTCASTSSEK